MNATDLLAGSHFKKIFVNGMQYTDGAPGTQAPVAYRWDLKCASCSNTWSVISGSPRRHAGPAHCTCGGIGFVCGVPVVASRG